MDNLAGILSLISTISYGIAAVAAGLAVFLWFKFKIPSVISDLSGRTARKSIARARMSNEKSGNKSYRPSQTNVARGELTGTMETAGKKRGLGKKKGTKPEAVQEFKDIVETGLLKETDDSTGILNAPEDTAPLSGETTLLEDPNATATLLNQEVAPVKRTGGKKVELLEEIVLIHTSEQID